MPNLTTEPRHDWTRAEIQTLYDMPFMELAYLAHSAHRANFDVNAVQVSRLLSVKTGACPEDCAYCPQSAHYQTDLTPEKLLPLPLVIEHAKAAKEKGASRFCMGAAWRHLPEKAVPDMVAMISAVKELGLETCVTLGMLNETQCTALKNAGLDYYNHNLDTSPEYYAEIITTRTYQDRLETLSNVQNAGIKVCCGGIVGLGESEGDRVGLLHSLSQLIPHPESVPINQLVAVAGTPLENTKPLHPFDFIRTIAVARIVLPKSVVRLSAGRETMSDEMQAWCFFVGANSIFNGEKLLTTPNPSVTHDDSLFERLGLYPMQVCSEKTACENTC